MRRNPTTIPAAYRHAALDRSDHRCECCRRAIIWESDARAVYVIAPRYGGRLELSNISVFCRDCAQSYRAGKSLAAYGEWVAKRRVALWAERQRSIGQWLAELPNDMVRGNHENE